MLAVVAAVALTGCGSSESSTEARAAAAALQAALLTVPGVVSARAEARLARRGSGQWIEGMVELKPDLGREALLACGTSVLAALGTHQARGYTSKATIRMTVKDRPAS